MRSVLTLVIALALVACGGGERSADRQPAGKSALPTSIAAIAGTTLDGDELAFADLRGRPVVVNVWSSW